MRIIILLLLFCNSAFGLTKTERVFNTLVSNGIDSASAKIYVAQACHESNCFKSKLAREHNNIFGVLHDKYRKTTSLGGFARAEGRSGYASYKTIELATLDFIYFLKHWNVPLVQSSCTRYSYALKRLRHKDHKRVFYTDSVENYRIALYRRYKQLWYDN